METSLSKEAEAILKEYKERGQYENASRIFNLPLPPERWWQAISKGAKSERPFWDTAKEISTLFLEDQTNPAWPPALFEIAEELPPISRNEAIVLIDRFLKIETGRLYAGVPFYELHWDVLSSHYCPLRERYQVLHQLVHESLLIEPVEDSKQEKIGGKSKLKWPLTITEDMIVSIRKSRLKWQLPTFQLIEGFLSNLFSSYPNIIKVLIYIIVGGILKEIIDFILKWYF